MSTEGEDLDISRAESVRGKRVSGRGPDSRQPELALTGLDQKIHETLRRELPPAETKIFPGAEPPPLMPVRRLHNYAYCPRLFYYQWVENIFVENADTVEGKSIHRQADQPSRLADVASLEVPEGRTLRSLQLESVELGLVGKIDVIEGGEDGIEVIDYKKGSARRDENNQRVAKEADALQVAAYAMLLRENGQTVVRGWIYYAADKRRVEVALSKAVFDEVRRIITEARGVAESGACPPPLQNDPRCLYCSAYPVCLPNESAYWLQPAKEKRTIEQAPRPPGDEGEVLVVQTPGSSIGFRGGEVVVSDRKTDTGKFPINQLRSIYVFGAVQVTAQAVQAFLEREIDVAYFSPAGRFLGLLRGLPASGVDARLGQYRMFGEPGIRLRLAAEVVRAKIHNQRVLLMRNGDAPDSALRTLATLRDRAPEAKDMTALLGVEGAAAALYFEHFPTMLKDRTAWAFDFVKRNRRPPRDPVNSLLSMGYSMLSKELAGVCHAVGLDPFLGFFHQPRYGRPALALDLMEEFRPLIADSVAISLLNRGELQPSDFLSSANGCFLNQEGRRAFWENYFRRMDADVTHPQFGYQMSYRRMLEVQARQLWRFVRGEAADYTGFTTR